MTDVADAGASGTSPPSTAGDAAPVAARRVTLAAVCVGYFAVILATTIVNVALPRIRDGLGARLAGLQWVVNGYVLVLASLVLIGGALGDRHGAKRVFVLGLALFTAASLLCGLAPTLAVLVAARVVQGAGAVLLIPTSLALLSQAYPAPAERAKAIGLWAAVTGTAQALGPLAGGLLVQAIGWRGVFLVNLPVGLAGLALALRVPASARTPGQGLDLGAQLPLVVALAALTVALIEGRGAAGWTSPLVLGALAAAVLAAAAFAAAERRAAAPMLPLALFANPAFSAGNALGLLIFFAYYGLLFVFSLFFQRVQGYSPLATGAAFLPFACGVGLVPGLSGGVAARYGAQPLIAAGLALAGLGTLGLAFVGPADGYWPVAGLFLLAGVGLGLAVAPQVTVVLGAVPQERAGVAAGAVNASRQIGAVVGVAVLGGFVGENGDPEAATRALHAAAVAATAALLAGSALAARFLRPINLPRREEEA